MIKAVLFDLDGTLLPMDQDKFIGGYFKFLAEKLAPHGYDSEKLLDGIWKGIAAMVKNDGSCTNEDAFWKCFSSLLGEHTVDDKYLFEEFYRTDFQRAVMFCDPVSAAADTIRYVKASGFRTALATNPIFPVIATMSRISWAGLNADDFEFITTYENSRFSKPNPEYYLDVASRLHLRPEECAMVGNDVTEDMVAETVGMKVFLLTDCIINRKNRDISAYPNGSFTELHEFIDNLKSV